MRLICKQGILDIRSECSSSTVGCVDSFYNERKWKNPIFTTPVSIQNKISCGRSEAVGTTEEDSVVDLTLAKSREDILGKKSTNITPLMTCGWLLKAESSILQKFWMIFQIWDCFKSFHNFIWMANGLKFAGCIGTLRKLLLLSSLHPNKWYLPALSSNTPSPPALTVTHSFFFFFTYHFFTVISIITLWPRWTGRGSGRRRREKRENRTMGRGRIDWMILLAFSPNQFTFLFCGSLCVGG
jgi:hypothetical protein